MDWIAFMEKKRFELMNTGHIMSDETFITHLLNSLPQTVYEGAILVIKDKLRKGTVEITEIEQILEDKFQAMKQAKSWEEEEDDYALFASPSNKKGPKKAFKGRCGYCGEFGRKAADCPNKKSNQNKGQKPKNKHKKNQQGKGDSKGKGHIDMSKIKCYNCGEFGRFARDCPKTCDNANIAQGSEQKGKSESMLDLDNISVREECAMVCMETQYEDASEDEVVYGDQGINTEEYKKATYGDLMKTQSEEENEVKCTVAQRANDSVILERKKRRFNNNNPEEKTDNNNQCDTPISEKSTENSINELTPVAQGPTEDDNKNKSRKAWTMEMLINSFDNSANMTSEEESMSDNERMFLYARAVHSNHLIQYHMHQIMERQRVIDEYRNMTMEGLDLIPLESNLHQSHPVIISQIINMIESDNFWHRKTFESVMSNLRNMWSEGIQELENARMRCTNNDKNNNEMDRIEVIDLCSVSQCGNDTISEGKESAMQESQDKSKHDETNKKVDELKTVRDESTTKKDNVESAMMCWESTESLAEKEHREEPEKEANKLVETTEKQKHEEEHVKPTLNTGNQLKILIEEFSWEREGNGSTLGMEEPEQQEIVYITNLEDGLRKDSTTLYDDEGPNEKKPAVRKRPIEVPSLNNPNHIFDIYGESDSDVNYIEDFSKGEDKRNSREYDYTNMDLEKEGKQADPQESNITRYHHNIPRKKGKIVPELNHDLFSFTKAMKDGWQMNGRWKEGGLMIEFFKTARASMKFDRMIPSGSSWLMGLRYTEYMMSTCSNGSRKIYHCKETSSNDRTHRRTSFETYSKLHETQAGRKTTTL